MEVDLVNLVQVDIQPKFGRGREPIRARQYYFRVSFDFIGYFYAPHSLAVCAELDWWDFLGRSQEFVWIFERQRQQWVSSEGYRQERQ